MSGDIVDGWCVSYLRIGSLSDAQGASGNYGNCEKKNSSVFINEYKYLVQWTMYLNN